MPRTALITGVTGQDGAYLAQFLLERGYRVHATYRRSSAVNFWRLQALGIQDHPRLHLEPFDLTDMGSAIRLIERTEPDELYNLAAQSFVGVSFDQPVATAQITGVGVLNLLEAVRSVNPRIRFYQASTSEMFGQVQAVPQTEDTPFHPRSPYGVAKLFAHWATVNYRESYDLFATSGILFNHESPLRGQEFVTRKITHGVARIHHGLQSRLELGNLDARRDWGYAPEYVEGMWRMLQTDRPDTYILATGRTESVRDFVTLAFRAAGIELVWEGEGAQEQGIDPATGQVRVAVNPAFYRPAEVDLLIGDPSKARRELDWAPRTDLETLCRLMVRADLERVAREAGRG
ncbi:GDP-mannose 4,6-dehydratase [Ectothiorhodospira mobilis]|uniref:GDP-mannose 4,6-dehydratase n=1 Tax=Ectothiorhodospira mobilis TaxID=195064 RepID=UPI0019081657|nr:GDP-mannose 4,6-dehydratase [Ectothiorhodospira mobilis]MBK1692007.1 GDP-mannose 4,6-dehydratase [Ectothiorhodospira mobilis]